MKHKEHKKQREPSLLRQIIAIHYEQMKRRKALKLLAKQSWSVDFLSVLLMKAVKLQGNGVQLIVTNKDGVSMTLKPDTTTKETAINLDDSIFNHLDDDMAINKFIRENSRR